MAGSQDEDMYLFQGGLGHTPTAFAGQDFDTFLSTSPGDGFNPSGSGDYMNPHDLALKQGITDEGLHTGGVILRSTRTSGSSSTSGGSPEYGKKDKKATGAAAKPSGPTSKSRSWATGGNGVHVPSASGEHFYDDTSMGGFDNDLDASNLEMASAFDFDTAASTPSGYDAASLATVKAVPGQAFRRTATAPSLNPAKTQVSRLPASGQAQFFLGSREASPLNAMLPQTQSTSPWTKHSPSSGLEETFNHITMNGDSPGNATFAPHMSFPVHGLGFDPESTNTPSSFHKELSSPPSTFNTGDGSTSLTIHPTSLKSRVETQIPIKMVIHPLPVGAKRLRLPTYTVSKPKFLAKPEVERSHDILELHTSLVCTSAMQDPLRLERALARARGEDLSAYAKPSPASSSGSQTSSKDDEDKPLNGGEVRICPGCIQRERKRASRKKQKKPEEEELFQKDEEKRVVVFNTSEIKDWVEAAKDGQSASDSTRPVAADAMQVELPMRIACYCRHQNEKLGFQVIFTIKDYRDKVIAQAMTNSIMITDDHKTHSVPQTSQTSQTPQGPTNSQLPGAGVFSSTGYDLPNSPQTNAKLFKQSFSTTDLHNLQHNFNPQFPMTPSNNPFTTSGPLSAASSGTMTPRILSRPASPSGPSGPHSKRRKQSGSGKVPSGLTMTRLDTSHMQTGAATMPNTAAPSPYISNMPSFMSATERYQLPTGRHQNYGTSPPTPNGHDAAFVAAVNRSFSLDNLPRQTLMSAPSSRQPSRPSSPRVRSSRNSFGANDSTFGQAVNNGLLASQPPQRPRPTIHKLVPAEGSVTGGTEVTLLGNGFYQGLEVMFGDTEATTTTFWGEKCLNCIAPPALQPGVVAVVFKHEHPQYATIPPSSQTRHSVFTYVDDREVEMLRLALRTIGKQMQLPTDDPYTTAQQLLQQNQPQQAQQPQQSMWPQHGGYSMAAVSPACSSSPMQTQGDLAQLERNMLTMLRSTDKLSRDAFPALETSQNSGLTMLHLASSLGLSELVSALLSAGADPKTKDNCGRTAMDYALTNSHELVVRDLMAAGAGKKTGNDYRFAATDLIASPIASQATMVSLPLQLSSMPPMRGRVSFISLPLADEQQGHDIAQSSTRKRRSAHLQLSTLGLKTSYRTPQKSSFQRQQLMKQKQWHPKSITQSTPYARQLLVVRKIGVLLMQRFKIFDDAVSFSGHHSKWSSVECTRSSAFDPSTYQQIFLHGANDVWPTSKDGVTATNVFGHVCHMDYVQRTGMSVKLETDALDEGVQGSSRASPSGWSTLFGERAGHVFWVSMVFLGFGVWLYTQFSYAPLCVSNEQQLCGHGIGTV